MDKILPVGIFISLKLIVLTLFMDCRYLIGGIHFLLHLEDWHCVKTSAVDRINTLIWAWSVSSVKIHIGHAQLSLEILGSKCFYKRFYLFKLGKYLHEIQLSN